mgnify:CR=1 FL=1
MALSKGLLMKKSVEDIINIAISYQEKYEEQKKKYDALRKVSASKELREEVKQLRAKVRKYETMVGKISVIE